MMRSRAVLFLGVTWSLACVIAGCDNDKEAVAALQELASEQTAIVEKQNDAIDAAVKSLEDCVGNITAVEDDSMILDTKGHDFKAPVLAGEPTIQALEALRTSIAETIELQKIELAKIETATKKCNDQLADAKEGKAEADAIEAGKGDAPK